MIVLLRTDIHHPDFEKLVQWLDEELYQRYPETQETCVPYNKMPDDTSVVLAYVKNEPAGCGCIRQYKPDIAEIKRMFVRSEFRGFGVSKAVLKELERWSRELHFKSAILETGLNQPEAIGLYTLMGYALIENYGPYADKEDSICFRKKL